MTSEDASNILFILDEEDVFEDSLNEYLEVTEHDPAGFEFNKLEGSLEDSEWSDQEGILKIQPTNFVIEVLSGEAPGDGSYSINFTGWQEAYVNVEEMTHGIEYHEPASVEIALKRTWRDNKNILYAEYEVVGVAGG